MWLPDSILHDDISKAEPKAVFEAVCVEIGRFFTKKYGFAYDAKKKCLKGEKDGLGLEICFATSRSNQKGSFILLEISNFVKYYPLKKWQKRIFISQNDIIFTFSAYNEQLQRYEKNFNLVEFSLPLFTIIVKHIDKKIILPFQQFLQLDATIPAIVSQDNSYFDLKRGLYIENFLHFLLAKQKYEIAATYLVLYQNQINNELNYFELIENLKNFANKI